MTIKEIAELANVSPGTVDRVIHNRGNVNPKKKAKIEKIISEVDFKPNVFARNLKLNREVRVGYITPTISSEDGYWDLVYQGVINAQRDLKDMSMSVKFYEYDRSKEGSFLETGRKMIAEGIDAAVIIAKSTEEALQFLKENPNLIYVLVDSDLEESNPISVVGQNPYRGGILAGKVLYLHSPNAKNFLTFSFKSSHISKERINGFIRFSKERGINVLNYNIDKVDDIKLIINDALSRIDKIDGVFIPFFAGYRVARELEIGHSVLDVPIVTYDFTEKNRQALLDGRISCILSQRPVFQGYSAIWQIYRHLILKEKVAKKVEVQVDVLFKESVPENYKASEEDARSNPYCIPKETEYIWEA